MKIYNTLSKQKEELRKKLQTNAKKEKTENILKDVHMMTSSTM